MIALKKIILKLKSLNFFFIGLYLMFIGIGLIIISLIISFLDELLFSNTLMFISTACIFIGIVIVIINTYRIDRNQEKILKDLDSLINFYRKKRQKEIFQEILMKFIRFEMENLSKLRK